jgi:hypothetical protein
MEEFFLCSGFYAFFALIDKAYFNPIGFQLKRAFSFLKSRGC